MWIIGKTVTILKGEHKGKKAAVTWLSEEEELIRVTPLHGDPLVSIQLDIGSVSLPDITESETTH